MGLAQQTGFSTSLLGEGKKERERERDYYVCNHAGNIVEWKYPKEVNLEEVEFKSMASGLHHIHKDFM